MKHIKHIFIFSILLVILNNCSGLKEMGDIMSNKKIKTTDEFLIKKNEPLTLPPDYEMLPKPNSSESKSTKKENTIEEMLKDSKSKSSSIKNKSSSTEASILNRIKK
jgi:hypothetical protein